MHPERAELSSVASTLTDLASRVTAAAERADAAKDESLAAGLFEVERLLHAAERRLSNTVGRLRD